MHSSLRINVEQEFKKFTQAGMKVLQEGMEIQMLSDNAMDFLNYNSVFSFSSHSGEEVFR